MRKFVLSALAFCLSLSLLGCGGAAARPSQYIEPARLSEEEENLANLLEMNSGRRIFDFVLDGGAESLCVTVYELIDGKWEALFFMRQPFAASSGRLALGFEKIPEGVRVALQSEDSSGANEYTPEASTAFAGMSSAVSLLSSPVEIVFEQELPLALQIVTAKNAIGVFTVDSFDRPEDFSSYEHVYAVTVCFSRAA